jgi:transposase
MDIDAWLMEDKKGKCKQRHTAKRIYDQLVEKHEKNFTCSYRTVAGYVAKSKNEIFAQRPGHLHMGRIDMEAQADFGWMLQVLQNAYSFSDAKNELGEIKELKTLLQNASSEQIKLRNRAISILARNRGIPFSTIANFLHISRKSVYGYLKCYQTANFNASFVTQSSRLLKANDEKNINAIFSLLHCPPIEFGINRTSWIMEDLKSCLEKRGVFVSKPVIREIIKKAGYRWKKAKVVLTSNDPQYMPKLQYIKEILSSLSKDERFFSCDEFGPFAIKMKGGRRLVAPGEYPIVPQFQKSKGFLILTGALELSTNQVTHFYSKKKNTDEMIRLLDVILKRYKGFTRIYLSWDAASWHISKKLNKRVDEVNDSSYRRKHKTAEVVVAPLPVSAQFLNVIESVFSGMSRAIIHNSNYGSVDEAKAAIDRYIRDRNKYFQDHPKVAGKKIWGRELVPSRFNEGENC